MATTAPGSGPNLIRDAHYHAIAATATWKAFAEALQPLAHDSPDQRAREAAERERETTYARGILGGH